MDLTKGELRILAADDDEFMQHILESTLKESGYSFKVVGDGLEFMDEFTLNEFDIVLLDINMPGLDGWDIISQIRKIFPEPKKSIPVIALTGHKGDDLIQKLKEYQFSYYLAKPFRRHDLDEAIKICLDGLDGFIAVNSQALKKTDKLIDTSQLESYSEGDTEFFRDMIETFLSTSPRSVLEIRNKILEKDWKGVAEEAHKFSPQLRFLGAPVIVAVVEEMEVMAEEGPADNGQLMELYERLDSMVAEANKLLINILNRT